MQLPSRPLRYKYISLYYNGTVGFNDQICIVSSVNIFAFTGTGLLDILGEDIFDTLLHVKTRLNVSLAFAIDYTSSMTYEISAVKEYVIQLLTSTIGSRYEPADYVLSLFHDPGIHCFMIQALIYS